MKYHDLQIQTQREAPNNARTDGEKGLKEGMVELKPRKVKENQLVLIENIVEEIKSVLQS